MPVILAVSSSACLRNAQGSSLNTRAGSLVPPMPRSTQGAGTWLWLGHNKAQTPTSTPHHALLGHQHSGLTYRALGKLCSLLCHSYQCLTSTVSSSTAKHPWPWSLIWASSEVYASLSCLLSLFMWGISAQYCHKSQGTLAFTPFSLLKWDTIVFSLFLLQRFYKDLMTNTWQIILCHHFPIFLLFSVRDKRTGPNAAYNTRKTQAQITAVRKHHYLPALYNEVCAMEASTVFTFFRLL